MKKKPFSEIILFYNAVEKGFILFAIKLALIVGAILNLINQGDRLISGEFHLVSWSKIILTFCVPFCVSLFSSVRAKLLINKSN